ncbi:mycofactocin biosynthesis peptidyl-dipeptidase MftE [soil metagenome]
MPTAGAALADLTWPVVAERAASMLVVVPVGSTEQHGPHLPLTTDTDLAVALASALVAARPDAVLAPALPYGASGEHAGFAGTLSIGSTALELVVVELVRSADAFAGVVLVSGHGGNRDALLAAEATATAEGRRLLLWSPSVPGGDAHAGRTETSLMLHVRPASVDQGSAAAGNTTDLRSLLPDLRAGGVAAVAPNGVLGDPTGATAEAGRELFDRLVRNLADTVAAWAP